MCSKELLNEREAEIMSFQYFFKGSGKSCFTGVLSLVFFKGPDLCSALLPHQPKGVSHPLHKPRVPFSSGQSAPGGYFGWLGPFRAHCWD